MLATVSNHFVEKKNELAVAVWQIKSKTNFCKFSGFLKAAIFYFQTDLMLIDCNTTDILRGILVFDSLSHDLFIFKKEMNIGSHSCKLFSNEYLIVIVAASLWKVAKEGGKER